jgi:hypothetical protein
MAKTSFWDHPIDKLEEALNLKKQIHALQSKLNSMFGGEEEETSPQPVKRGPGRPRKDSSHAASPATPPAKRGPGRPPKSASAVNSPAAQPAKRGRKPFSAETKAKMAAAQRWAGKRGAGTASSARPAKTGKRTVSPDVRARLAAAMKARWAAAKRKGLPGPNARK